MCVLIGALIATGGCGKKESLEQPDLPEIQTSRSSLEITDARGRTVSFQHPAIKVVSLVPSLTEYLYELDKGHLLVGRGEQCDYPAQTKELPVAGTQEEPDLARMVNLKPDVVLVDKLMPQNELARLEEAGLRVVVFDHQNWESLCRDLDILGKILDAEGDIRTLVAWMDKKRQNVKSEVKSLPEAGTIRIVVLGTLEPLSTFGKNTFIDEFIQLAGGRNLAADLPSARPILTEDQLLQGQPEVMLVAVESARQSGLLDELLARESWSGIPAIRNQRIYKVASDTITIPGPRQMRALGQIAAAIHPESFDTSSDLIEVEPAGPPVP